MHQAYNFLASWQLIPEKCNYQSGVLPRSGIFKMEKQEDTHIITVTISWVTFENQSYKTSYTIIPDNLEHSFDHPEVADTICTSVSGSHQLLMETKKGSMLIWRLLLEIQPNGYLKITQNATDDAGNAFTNIQFYHKQLSVLPYASSVSGAVIKHTKEGVIKHKALSAMEEQTNMQLDQIRQQIELLAQQAHAIQKRKELSMRVYDAKLSFRPVIGHTYHLYEKHDSSFMLSMIGPGEWGSNGPFKQFVSTIKLLADHTWVEVDTN